MELNQRERQMTFSIYMFYFGIIYDMVPIVLSSSGVVMFLVFCASFIHVLSNPFYGFIRLFKKKKGALLVTS